MYMEAGEPHHTPHFHAYYQQYAAVFSIDSVELMEGSLPQKQERLVVAWAELHTEELERCWELLQHGHSPIKIDPLR